jgi:hypothetical protein
MKKKIIIPILLAVAFFGVFFFLKFCLKKYKVGRREKEEACVFTEG